MEQFVAVVVEWNPSITDVAIWKFNLSHFNYKLVGLRNFLKEESETRYETRYGPKPGMRKRSAALTVWIMEYTG